MTYVVERRLPTSARPTWRCSSGVSAGKAVLDGVALLVVRIREVSGAVERLVRG